MGFCGPAANWNRMAVRHPATMRRNASSCMSQNDPRIGAFLQETKGLLDRLDMAAIQRAKEMLLACYQAEGRVYTIGNGGSASTAHHFACDLAKYVIPD